MTAHPLSERYFDGPQGRLVELLRGGPRTVDELARELELTGNAVRLQLSALERDGLARVEGRRPSGRKPALLYGLTRKGDLLLSRSYLPLLQALLTVLDGRYTPAERAALLREAGRRLVAGMPPVGGTRKDRLQAAVRVLDGLGGRVRIETGGGATRLAASGCPLGELVGEHPEVCRAVEAAVSEVTGLKIREHCDRGERPRCSFQVE